MNNYQKWMGKKVKYQGEEWIYSPDLHWHVERKDLSNAGLWRCGNSKFREYKRQGVSFELKDLEFYE